MSLNVTKTISKELFIPFNLQILSIWWRDVECWATARFVCWLSDFLIDRIYPNLESISDNERCPESPSFIYEIHYRKSVGEMARWEREREREREREIERETSQSVTAFRWNNIISCHPPPPPHPIIITIQFTLSLSLQTAKLEL